MNIFEKLSRINVNEHTEKKKSLTYLSWAWAWSEVKKNCPDADYSIKHYDGKPYLFDEKLGYMVFTSVTIEGEKKTMWLPVMDGANKAMKSEPYTYTTKYSGEKTVEAATMFDINKALMRCLTKNLAMFGLGIYIYAGEDLPETDQEEILKEKEKQENLKALQGSCDGLIKEAFKLEKNGFDSKENVIKTFEDFFKIKVTDKISTELKKIKSEEKLIEFEKFVAEKIEEKDTEKLEEVSKSYAERLADLMLKYRDLYEADRISTAAKERFEEKLGKLETNEDEKDLAIFETLYRRLLTEKDFKPINGTQLKRLKILEKENGLNLPEGITHCRELSSKEADEILSNQ